MGITALEPNISLILIFDTVLTGWNKEGLLMLEAYWSGVVIEALLVLIPWVKSLLRRAWQDCLSQLKIRSNSYIIIFVFLLNVCSRLCKPCNSLARVHIVRQLHWMIIHEVVRSLCMSNSLSGNIIFFVEPWFFLYISRVKMYPSAYP